MHIKILLKPQTYIHTNALVHNAEEHLQTHFFSTHIEQPGDTLAIKPVVTKVALNGLQALEELLDSSSYIGPLITAPISAQAHRTTQSHLY